MNEELKYNLENYLHTDTKKQIFFYGMVFFLLILIILSFHLITINNVEKTNANVICEDKGCKIHFFHYGTLSEKWQTISIKNQKYNIHKITIGDSKINNKNEIIQEIFLDLENYQGKNNEIIEIEIEKSKEKLIKKIIKR